MSDLVDKLGRKLLECPADKRGQYPASPVCCGEPLVWGGHLLRCNSCGAYGVVTSCDATRAEPMGWSPPAMQLVRSL